MNESPTNRSHALCIGHRGARGHVPENTLASFEYAISLGCDWIELDVYAHEGELIVIHDDDLDRTTNGSGPHSNLSFDALRALDAGNGEQIPTLNEVINLVDRRCGINVELKGTATAEPVSALLRSCCEAGWSPESFLVSSFRHQELQQADPLFRRGALFGRILPDLWERAERLDAWSVNFDLKDVTSALVDEAHSRGYQVLVYTVNEVSDIKRMLSLGVDGLFCDYPDRMLSLR